MSGLYLVFSYASCRRGAPLTATPKRALLSVARCRCPLGNGRGCINTGAACTALCSAVQYLYTHAHGWAYFIKTVSEGPTSRAPPAPVVLLGLAGCACGAKSTTEACGARLRRFTEGNSRSTVKKAP
jgi:hypothetical protein